MLVIGVTGLPGSGKTVFAEAAKSLGIPVINMGDMVKKEVLRRGLEITPDNVSRIAIKLREEMGPNAVAKLVVREIERNPETYLSKGLLVIDGVRSPAEVEYFRKKFHSFIIVAIHASPKERHERLLSRGRADDAGSLQKIIERDKRELSFGVAEVIAFADYMLVNSGKSRDEFFRECRAFLESLLGRRESCDC